MGVTVSHQLSATTPDDPGYEIQPQHWNQSHAFTLNAVGSEIANAFANGNGISFGLSAGSVSGSYTVPSTAGLISAVNVSAGTTSNNLSALTFSNANNFSFGLNGSVITGSYTVPTVTNSSFSVQDSATTINPVQRIAFSTGNNITFTLSTGASSATVGVAHNLAGTSSGFAGNLISGSMTHNSSGLNLSLNHPAWLTTAMQSNAATISNINISAGTTSTNASAFTFNNANGVSFGLGTGASAGSITASVNTSYRASNDGVGLNTAQSNVTWTVNSSGLSFDARGYAGTATTFNGANISGSMTLNSNGLNLSLSGAGGGTTNQTGPNIAAGTQTATSGTVVFSNSNGVSFGMSDSSIVTASFDPINIGVSNLGNTLGTTGTVDGRQGQYIFVGGNGVTLSQSTNGASSGTVTISAQTQATVSSFAPPWAYSGMATNSSLGQSTLYFMPVDIPDYLYASRINFYVSISGALSAGNSTGTCSAGIGYGIYTLNSDSLSRLTSYSAQIHSMSMTSNTAFNATHYFGLSNATSHSTQQTGLSATNASTYLATNMNGQRVIALPVNSTLTPGRYWVGMSVQTVAGNAMTNNLSVMITSVGVQPDIRYMGVASAATNASVFRMMQGLGSYSAQSAAWPNSIAYTTDNIRAAVNQTLVHFQIVGASFASTYL